MGGGDIALLCTVQCLVPVASMLCCLLIDSAIYGTHVVCVAAGCVQVNLLLDVLREMQPLAAYCPNQQQQQAGGLAFQRHQAVQGRECAGKVAAVGER